MNGDRSLRLLHFADLHLDAPFAWAPPGVAQARRQALRDALAEICRLAREREVDALTCAGDLYEQERFSPDTGGFLVSLFATLGRLPVLIAPGNHDWLAPSSIYQTAGWPANVHVFRSDRLEPYELGGDVTVWGAAHRAPANTDDFLRGFQAGSHGVNVGLFHASERSALTGQEPGKQPHAAFSAYEIRAAGLHHALLGHYHAPVDGADLTYPGNPEPLSFGEHGERGAVLVEIGADGSIARERIRVARTALTSLEVEVTGAASAQDVIERVRAVLAGRTGLARVALGGEVEPALALDPAQLPQGGEGLDWIAYDLAGIRPAYDLDAIGSEQTVRGQFVRDVLAARLDEGERRRVIVTGLRALSGRSDLMVER